MATSSKILDGEARRQATGWAQPSGKDKDQDENEQYSDREIWEDPISTPQESNGEDEPENAAFVAVMGMTGAGKSTFIKTVTGADVVVGHDLKSCTEKVTSYPFRHRGTQWHLVDTPGFDDSTLSDVEVLQEISTWLAKAYNESQKLAGIIYLHKITDNRMGHLAMLNVNMFRELCGDNFLPNVVLTTTFWDRKNQTLPLLLSREEQLTTSDDYWGPLMAMGVRKARYDNTRSGALNIMKMFTPNSNIALKIQLQMVKQKLSLGETRAGQSLEVELNRERANHQKKLDSMNEIHEQALKDHDEKQAALMEKLRAKMEDKLRLGEQALQRLQETFEVKLARERAAREQEERNTEDRLKQQRDAHERYLAQERAARKQEQRNTEERFKQQQQAQEEATRQQEAARARYQAEQTKEARERDTINAREREAAVHLHEREQDRLREEKEKDASWYKTAVASLFAILLLLLGLFLFVFSGGSISILSASSVSEIHDIVQEVAPATAPAVMAAASNARAFASLRNLAIAGGSAVGAVTLAPTLLPVLGITSALGTVFGFAGMTSFTAHVVDALL